LNESKAQKRKPECKFARPWHWRIKAPKASPKAIGSPGEAQLLAANGRKESRRKASKLSRRNIERYPARRELMRRRHSEEQIRRILREAETKETAVFDVRKQA